MDHVTEYYPAETGRYPRISPIEWYSPIFKTHVHYIKSQFKIFIHDERVLYGCSVHEVVPEIAQKKTSHAAKSELFENIFFSGVVEYLKDYNLSVDKHPCIFFHQIEVIIYLYTLCTTHPMTGN